MVYVLSCLILIFLWLWIRERDQKKEALLRLSFSEKENKGLAETFKTLSHDALEKNNRSFLELATEMVAPVKETLSKISLGMQQLEKERKGDHLVLQEQVRALLQTEKELRHETANLVKALRSPLTRGRWGEIQLRRVVELAGMLSHCDFSEQQSGMHEEGNLRPDLIVHLPGGRQVVVDAKAPLEAYLEAIHMQDEKAKEAKMRDHARQIRQHMGALSKKAYWERFQPTPEFVVLFLPAETFFSAALEFDPALIEVGADSNVILATPTTLIALLRSVAYGWKQESLSRHAEEVRELGHELYKRLVDMNSHFAKMGRGLSSAIDGYNKAMGSLESRVLVTARKFQEMGAASTTLDFEAVERIDKVPRNDLNEQTQPSQER
jgi:DNA recombination protein RmuC